MGRRRILIDMRKAFELRQSGKSWDWLGAFFGVHPNTVQDRLEPDAKAKRYERQKVRLNHVTNHRAHAGDPPIDERTMAALIPVDDRNRMERFFGDPPPGRSSAGRRVER